MRLYKVVLADDEAEVRLGMRNRVPWKECGFEVVGDAENGQEALELCEALSPDLVVTDIKMPFMDGIALVKKLRCRLPLAKTVIITGFEDFEYAKMAVELNVTQYILKPVNVDEFTNELKKIKKNIDNEFSVRRDMEQLRKHFFESRPILQENFLVSLLEGRVEGDQAVKMAKSLEMDNLLGPCAVACCRLDLSGRHDDPSYSSMLPLLIKQLAIDTLSSKFACYATIYTNFIVIAVSLEKESVTELLPVLDEICMLAQTYHELNVSMGLGYVAENVGGIHHSYIGARAALDYRFMLGAGHAIFIQDIEPNQSAAVSFGENDGQGLLSVIRLGEEDGIKKYISELLSRCEDERIPYAQVQVYILSIISCIYKIANTYKMGPDAILGKGMTPAGKLASFDSMDSVRQWLATLSMEVADHLRNVHQSASGNLVQAAQRYAQENYWRHDFSVDNMCKEMHISASYFSYMYKKETGTSFINYLTDLRMSHARRMLVETDEMTYLIAEKVGYSDANYFSYAFKKCFGVSPSKFRGKVIAD